MAYACYESNRARGEGEPERGVGETVGGVTHAGVDRPAVRALFVVVVVFVVFVVVVIGVA